ncbi:MAG TPA: hypothetical protein VIT41_00835 [Microlunatus sp.]
MVQTTEPRVEAKGQMRPTGLVGLIAGVITSASAAAVAVISFTPADPPAWMRINTFWLLLLGIPVSIVLGLAAKRGKGQLSGLIGAGLGVTALIALVVMQFAAV